MTLKYELEDLEAAWDFAKKDENDSDGEEEVTPGLKEAGLRVKELTFDDLDLVNDAIKSHLVVAQEIKKKVEHELTMAESAAIGGWQTVDVLENKNFENVSGTAAEKEMKTIQIRKAQETAAKERRLFAREQTYRNRPGAQRIQKRPKYSHGTPFGLYDGMLQQPRRPRNRYDHRERRPHGGQGGYGSQAPAGAGYGDGRGHYASTRGGSGAIRTCHRLAKSTKPLVPHTKSGPAGARAWATWWPPAPSPAPRRTSREVGQRPWGRLRRA